MPRQYSSQDFFRHMPNALLERFFHQEGLFQDLDFQAMKETRPLPLLEAWAALPDDRRAKLEADLQAVHEMSSRKGLVAIQDAARAVLEHDPGALADLMAKLAALEDYGSQAMTAFLNHRDLWPWAERFHHADRLTYWKKRKNLPQVDAACDPESLERLESLMKQHFVKAEGRGRNCKVEHYRRGDKDYFFAFPEDYAARAVEWVEGSFDARPYNPAFEVVFVYRKAEGSLNLFCRTAHKAVVPLQEMFARAILKLEALAPEPKDARVYDLNPLKKSGFEFAYPPESGIGGVVVKRLRLSSSLRAGDRITLEAITDGNRLAVYDLLEEVSRGLPVDKYHVTQVELSASVWGPNGRAQKVNFTVTYPNSCSLRNEGVDEALREMLAASGIEPKAKPKPAATPDDSTMPAAGAAS